MIPYTPSKPGMIPFVAGQNPAAPVAPATPNLGQRTGAEQVAGVEKIGSSIATGIKGVTTPTATPFSGTPAVGALGTELKKAGEMVGGVAGTIVGAGQSVLAPVTATLSPIFAKMNENLRKSNVPGLNQSADAISAKLQELSSKHPESSTIIGDIVTALTMVGGGEAIMPTLKKTLATGGAKDILPTITGDIKSATTLKTGIKATAADATEKAKINELIAPKPTIKQAKLAQAQGRLIEGKKPTLFKSGTEKQVIPSARGAKTIQTIQDQIPGASSMDESTLYTALDKKTTEIATQLKPVLEKTPVQPATIDSINTEWKTLKESQISEVAASMEKDTIKRQANFEKFLEKSKSGNLNDLWDTRKAYDSSIKDNVKKATEQSDAALYQQKEEWLQNRRILNKALDEATKGLDQSSQKAFSDMTDMYNAREGINSKATIETKTQPSKTEQFVKKHKVGAAIVGGTIVGATGLPKAALGAIGL